MTHDPTTDLAVDTPDPAEAPAGEVSPSPPGVVDVPEVPPAPVVDEPPAPPPEPPPAPVEPPPAPVVEPPPAPAPKNKDDNTPAVLGVAGVLLLVAAALLRFR